MTADAPAPRTPGAAPGASAHDGPERRRARRAEAWSIAWTVLSLALWLWLAFLMLADYGPESYGDRPVCRSPLADPSPGDSRCADSLRQWPALLGILGLTTLATVTAAATKVYAKVLFHLAERDESGARPQD
ncbi:hypothetical protein AB0H29_03205 [Streptomyces thermolilacinus]